MDAASKPAYVAEFSRVRHLALSLLTMQNPVSDTKPAAASPELPKELPDFADALLAYHRSHAETLNALVARLPLARGQSILDVATGDGTYAILMAQRGANVVVLTKTRTTFR